ncbi:hypothetical protein CEXT_160791 [Caerostris extrusa]|uniref:Uncharacterized protein n=1 Tax=Caerostris extrusa TaxID=172846 RepID=A0AAV4XS17_CAEEX|nr:hypothetical protein CEXT_160791 [Caerostris extrusa]
MNLIQNAYFVENNTETNQNLAENISSIEILGLVSTKFEKDVRNDEVNHEIYLVGLKRELSDNNEQEITTVIENFDNLPDILDDFQDHDLDPGEDSISNKQDNSENTSFSITEDGNEFWRTR